MKKILLIILLYAAGVSFAQVKVPDKVKSAFENKFPSATAVKWVADDDEFTVDFASDSVYYFATFSVDGGWVETGVMISYGNLPDAVKKAVKDKFKDNEIKRCYSVKDFKGIIYYEVDVIKDSKTIELYFNKDGTEADDE